MGPDNQGGFNWTVTFTSDNQDGDLPLVTVEANALTGTDARIGVYSVVDGSYVDGFVNVTFDGNSTSVAANATAEHMRIALESIGTGKLGVTREGAAALGRSCPPVVHHPMRLRRHPASESPVCELDVPV